MTGGFDFTVLAPLGFVSIGALSVLLVEMALSRSLRGDVPADTRLARTSRIGSELAIPSTVALALSI